MQNNNHMDQFLDWDTARTGATARIRSNSPHQPSKQQASGPPESNPPGRDEYQRSHTPRGIGGR